MDSFTRQVKEEIVHKQFSDIDKKAILIGFIQLNSILKENDLILTSSNNAVIRFIHQTLKFFYKLEIDISIFQNSKFKKLNVYRLTIKNIGRQIYNDLAIDNFNLVKSTFLNNQSCKRAYIAGAFLASGSINSPKTSNYHLEITNNRLVLVFLQKLIHSEFKLNFKIINRKQKSVLYLKNSLGISDFLKLVDSSSAVLKFENERISRDMFNSINRLNNIEISNQQRVLIAGSNQIKMINFLNRKHQLNWLSLKSQRIAILRLKNPELSLNELCIEYQKKFNLDISKSGMNHAFREIKEAYLKSKDI